MPIWHCPFYVFTHKTDNAKFTTEKEAMAAILILSILINRSYFQINALKPGIHRFSVGVCESIGIVRFHV